MRKVLLAVSAALASAAVLAGGAGGTHSNGTGPKQDLVAGTGTLICCGEPQVHVNAHRDKETGEVRGHFYIRYPSGVEFGGRVVCLTTALNFAGLTGRIDRVKMPNPALGFVQGNYVPIRITDNGEPGALDLVNFDVGRPTQPADCSGAGDLPLQQGNFIVHADPPLSILDTLDLLIAEFEAAAGEH
jgi:hypothetical protein